jgi:pyrroline-5-carboxylate reductase
MAFTSSVTTETALGIIGVGGLADFVVQGLRRAGDRRKILLSPRNAERAAMLVKQCDATIMPDNQAVIDAAELILVAVPPAAVYDCVKALRWRSGQVLICVAIDVTEAGLQAAAPGAAVVRAMPSSCAALNAGGTPVFPANKAAVDLFGKLGDVFPVETEAQFNTAAAIAAYYLWSFAVIDAVAERAVAEGLPPEIARGLTAALTGGAAAVAGSRPDLPARTPLETFGRPGTMTRQGWDVLTRSKSLDAWSKALDIAIARMRSSR